MWLVPPIARYTRGKDKGKHMKSFNDFLNEVKKYVNEELKGARNVTIIDACLLINNKLKISWTDKLNTTYSNNYASVSIYVYWIDKIEELTVTFYYDDNFVDIN